MNPQLITPGGAPPNPGVEAARAAAALYEQTQRRGRLHRAWAILTRRSTVLLDLRTVAETQPVAGQSYAGLQEVPLAAIRGTEGRGGEFDAGFRPRRAHIRTRWLGVATAWHLNCPLPPIELIQVGDIYFVRDGHHRVSVAAALGARYIDARVTVWHLQGRAKSPCQASLPGLVAQPRGC